MAFGSDFGTLLKLESRQVGTNIGANMGHALEKANIVAEIIEYVAIQCV